MMHKQKWDEQKNIGYSISGVLAIVFALALSAFLVCFGIYVGTNDWTVKEVAQDSTVKTTDDSKENVAEGFTESIRANKVTESDSVENGPNYIYERISWDNDEVAVLGDVTVEEENLAKLNKVLSNYSKKIGIKAVTVDGTKGLSYNSEDEFFMASAVKAPYLLYAYQQMNAGNGSPGEEMKYTGNYYNLGTGVMRYQPVGTVFTLEEIMYYTMRKSDNVGYNMCIGRWGKEGYNELMGELGCDSFVLEDWTPWVHEGRVDDLLIIWNEIYKFMNNGSESARLLYDSCTYIGQTADYNFMKNVLPDTLVSQKYGWSEDGYGNCAIVYGENQTYIVSVFMDSSGTGEDQLVYRDVIKLVDELLDK